MHQSLKNTLLLIVIALLSLVAVFYFADPKGVTSLVTGSVVAPIIPQTSPFFDEDKVIMRVSAPSCASGCYVDKWYLTTFTNVILNPNTVRPADSVYNPHTCTGQNQIGYLHPSGYLFYSYEVGNPPPPTIPYSNVCYSDFHCMECSTTDRGPTGCDALALEGYDCYFSAQQDLSTELLAGQVYTCNLGPPKWNYMCRDCSMKCPLYIEDLSSNYVPFTECVDDGSNICCEDFVNSCVYNNACYGEGDVETINNLDMVCTNQHWCPDGFYYDPSVQACRLSRAICYDVVDPDLCNYVYPGSISTDPYWTDTDSAGDLVCVAEPALNPSVAFAKACCTVTVSTLDFYFYQDITLSSNVDPTYIDNVNICGDTYTAGVSDGFCPSEYAGCTPGAVNDPDCCNKCGWVCDNANNLCGDNPGELWQEEHDSIGNTVVSASPETCSGSCEEHVIDIVNEGACVTAATSCTDDYTAYTDYSSGVCTPGVNCYDVDSENADLEICDNGNWHDPDESEAYCLAANVLGVNTWTTALGGEDDYDNNVANGYCIGDDGFTISGYVYDEEGEPLENVHIQFKEVTVTDTVLQEAFTNVDGYYTTEILAGDYNFIVEKPLYIPQTVTMMALSVSTTQDFTLYSSTECLADCTKNDGYCHAECAGVNGCAYPTDTNSNGQTVADVCNGLGEGWVRPFEAGVTEVVCCNNAPTAVTTTATAAAPAAVDDVYTTTRLVKIRGKVVQLQISVWE